MNFLAFPVESTNIFPLANSSRGGQLLSEYNIRSRESVETDPTVKYFIGKSFVHSEEDFKVYCQKDGYDTTISNTTIQIQPGRGVINGHYVELLTPINIDINDANHLANQEGIASLKGDLAVGLRMVYNTHQTLAGTAMIENEDGYYDGVQVVIVPKNDVKLPQDVPGDTEFTKVNMHLLLANFSFRNGVVTSVKQNASKLCSIGAERVGNIKGILSDTYISKANLDPNKLYVFSGKSSDGTTLDGRDTWCDATDSEMIWDKSPQISTVLPSNQSYFSYDKLTDSTNLVAAHKQVDGMVNTGGQRVYYQDRSIPLPSANFDEGTGGVVTKKYTSRIKSIRDKLNNLMWYVSGSKMLEYIDVLTTRDIDKDNVGQGLPPVPVPQGSDATEWEVGDFILVGQDQTIDGSVDGRYPSTMYIVVPGTVKSIVNAGVYVKQIVLSGKDDGTGHIVTPEEYEESVNAIKRAVPVNSYIVSPGIELASVENPKELTSSMWNPLASYRGRIGRDYFVARNIEHHDDDPDNIPINKEKWTCTYWVVTGNNTTDGSNIELDVDNPVWITGGVPYASESAVGGFLNVPEDSYGSGYVRMDDTGHLKVVDYDLLLTGVLAYQLGQDRSEGSGLGIEEIQSTLEEYVNDRTCYPNADQQIAASEAGTDPTIINLYLELPAEGGEITIHDIGSKYNSSLFVHISGAATSDTTITFKNCDKLRIDPNIEGAPNIILDRVNLYYDAEVLDRCISISNMTLWYERYDVTDPNLQISGMTVTLLGTFETTENIDPWDSEYANDNHYAYALRSLTFGNDGSIINVGLLVGDSTTANIDEGRSAFASEFILPQSVGIGYPATKMTHRIKISGTFVSHYYVASENAYMMKATDFSAITQKYNPLTGANEVGGTISFYTDAQLLSHINGVPDGTTIDGWDLNTPHFFTGGVIE